MNKLTQLIQSGKTVFTIPELTDIWASDYDTVKTTVSRMVQKKNLIRLKRGFFGLGKNINLHELACKLVIGSYISLFTVLKEKGVIFQEYRTIYLIAPRPQMIQIQEQKFEYHTIKKVTYFPDGIEFKENYSIATIERALLDTFSVFDTDYSDFKISQFDRDIFIKLSKFYNKKTQKKAQQFLTHFSL